MYDLSSLVRYTRVFSSFEGNKFVNSLSQGTKNFDFSGGIGRFDGVPRGGS
jgi:hypothetical protein